MELYLYRIRRSRPAVADPAQSGRALEFGAYSFTKKKATGICDFKSHFLEKSMVE